jgi:hypothetical protein
LLVLDTGKPKKWQTTNIKKRPFTCKIEDTQKTKNEKNDKLFGNENALYRYVGVGTCVKIGKQNGMKQANNTMHWQNGTTVKIEGMCTKNFQFETHQKSKRGGKILKIKRLKATLQCKKKK